MTSLTGSGTGYTGSKYGGYYEPSMAQATHMLDGTEPVTRKRPAAKIQSEINRPRREDGRPSPKLYPQIDRSRARKHGLFLVHTIAATEHDFNGELAVTGDRLTEITDAQRSEFTAKHAAARKVAPAEGQE